MQGAVIILRALKGLPIFSHCFIVSAVILRGCYWTMYGSLINQALIFILTPQNNTNRIQVNYWCDYLSAFITNLEQQQ